MNSNAQTLPNQSSAAVGRKLFADLKALNDSLDPIVNKNDRVIVLATVCIQRGANKLSTIIRFLTPLGFDHRHIAAIVRGNTGINPDAYRWHVDAAGRFRLNT